MDKLPDDLGVTNTATPSQAQDHATHIADHRAVPQELVPTEGLSVPAAAAIALSAYAVPYLLSRSTAPSPNHPAIAAWYLGLRKPSYNPPAPAFPIAWLAIETGLAYSGFLLLRSPASQGRNKALALLAGNLLGIGGWSRLFFGSKNLPLSTISAVALGGSALASVVQTSKVDRSAAVASLPLVPWIAFATIITASLWRRNKI